MNFEVVGGSVAGCRMTSFGVLIGDVVAGFQPSFGQTGEAAAVKQFRFEAAPKRFGVGVVVAVAAPAHALHSAVPGEQVLEPRGRVLAALVGLNSGPGRGPAHHQGPPPGFADLAFGHRVAHVPADNLARATVQSDGQIQPAAALAR